MKDPVRFTIGCIVIFLVFAWMGNTVAMNQLTSVVGSDVVKDYVRFDGVYLNPLSFIILYRTYGKVAPSVFESILFMYGGILLAGILIPALIKQFGVKKERTSEGSAKWASIRDLRKKKTLVSPNQMNATSGVICGTWYTGLVDYESLYNFVNAMKQRFHWSNDTFWSVLNTLCIPLGVNRYYIVDNASTHVFLCAPSRSGKGIGPIASTHLHWKDSMIVADLKGENMREFGPYRQFCLGHKVIAFAPTDTRPTARFNPINEIRWGTPNEGKDVANIVTLLVGAPEGKDAHWKSNAISIIVGALTHLKYQHARQNENKGLAPGDVGYIETNMYHVYEFLSTSKFDETTDEYTKVQEKIKDESLKKHFPATLIVHNDSTEKAMLRRHISIEKARTITTFSEEALNRPEIHPVVAASFQSFISKPDDEGGSVLSTAVTALSMFSEKIIVDNTCTSDFVIGDIRGSDRPVDLFLQVPPSDLSRVDKLFALIFEFIIQRVTENEERAKKERKCLLLIDEWPAFGKMSTLVKELGFIASYGLKAMLIVQGLDQVKEIYGDKLPFLSNCQTQIFFEGKDDSTPKYVADKLGKETIIVKQKSSDGGVFSKSNITHIEKGRLLMDAAEVATMHNTSIMFLDELKVKTPKLKWFITEDLSWRLNEGKRRDTLKRVGLRDVVDVAVNPFQYVPWYTESEIGDGHQGAIEQAIENLCPITPFNQSSIPQIVSLIRWIHLSMDYHNTTQALTASMAAYQSVSANSLLERMKLTKLDDLREADTRRTLLDFLRLKLGLKQDATHPIYILYQDSFSWFDRTTEDELLTISSTMKTMFNP